MQNAAMFRCLVLLAAFILIPFFLVAQDEPLDLQPTPVGGLERLALVFLKTDFTPEQRTRLNDVRLELIFFVDSTGMAFLEDVNGINDPDIIDSLKQGKDIPPFRPRYVNGQFRNGIFFMMLTFPSYDMRDEERVLQRYGSFPIDQLEEVNYSGQSLQMMIGGVVNSFAGSPSRYLSPGGGLKMDVLWGFDKWGAGFSFAAYGNRAREYYPIRTTRELDKAPSTFVIALLGSINVINNPKRIINLQLELGYVGQTVSSRIDDYDEDYIQLRGFSPGLVVNYQIPIGKGRFQNRYYFPSVTNHYLNVHAAARPIFLNLKEARGMMFEFGISYRFSIQAVHAYQLKK